MEDLEARRTRRGARARPSSSLARSNPRPVASPPPERPHAPNPQQPPPPRRLHPLASSSRQERLAKLYARIDRGDDVADLTAPEATRRIKEMDRLGVDADAPRYLTYPERLGLAPPPTPTEGEAKAPDDRTRANERPLGPPTKTPLSREEARRLVEARIRAAPLVLEDPAAANEDEKKASDKRAVAKYGRFLTMQKSDDDSREPPSGFELATPRSRRRPVASRPYDVSVGVEPAPTRTDAEIDAAAGAIRAPGARCPAARTATLDQVD